MRLVQALHWLRDMIGREEDPALDRRLRRLMNDPEQGPSLRADLADGMTTLPAWMQALLKPMLANPKARNADAPVASLPLGDSGRHDNAARAEP